jgi:hypothetical protein
MSSRTSGHCLGTFIANFLSFLSPLNVVSHPTLSSLSHSLGFKRLNTSIHTTYTYIYIVHIHKQTHYFLTDMHTGRFVGSNFIRFMTILIEVLREFTQSLQMTVGIVDLL